MHIRNYCHSACCLISCQKLLIIIIIYYCFLLFFLAYYFFLQKSYIKNSFQCNVLKFAIGKIGIYQLTITLKQIQIYVPLSTVLLLIFLGVIPRDNCRSIWNAAWNALYSKNLNLFELMYTLRMSIKAIKIKSHVERSDHIFCASDQILK